MIIKPDDPAPTLSLRPRAFAAVRWTALRQALDEGARLLVFLALARLLAPSVYGQMAIIGMLLALGNLLADHETLVRELRADLQTAMDKFGDAGTSDFMTGLMEKHEKMAWMLRSFLS